MNKLKRAAASIAAMSMAAACVNVYAAVSNKN